jgi:heptosyltransferase-3
MAPRLGDSLLVMTVANNLRLHGRDVTVFGDYIFSLKDWFPGLDIRPSLPEEAAAATLKDFDLTFQMHVDWPYSLEAHTPHYLYYNEIMPITGKGFVKLYQIAGFCRDYLRLPSASTDNGLRTADPLAHRSHDKRVVIHPTSTGEQRCWAPRHFKALGCALKALGYEPNYIVAPHERDAWKWLLEHDLAIPQFDSLGEVAAFIHSSGWFIGNESGIGHLSSNLGIPTLSVTGRPTRTKAWRPAWSPSEIVFPAFIPGGRLRDRYWRDLLSPGRVMSAFEQLRKKAATGLTPPPAA